MTQKDYIAVAAALKAHQRPMWAVSNDPEVRAFNNGREHMRAKLADDLADIFANDNPRFKRDVFLKASGLS